MQSDEIDDYIDRHIGAEHPYLHHLYRQTHLHLTRPRMASGHAQGKLLRMLTGMIRPRLVYELGTYSGYSALCIASALTPDAVLHTFEKEDEIEDFTRPMIEGSPWADRVQMHYGDALALLPAVAAALAPERADMVFVDADKRRYPEYYEMLFPLVNVGGYIVADNTLWYGRIVSEALSHDAQTRGILAFNDIIASDPRVEKVILPLRDGLTIIKKVSE